MIFNTLDELKEAVLKHHKGEIRYGLWPDIDAFHNIPKIPYISLEESKKIIDDYLSSFTYKKLYEIIGGIGKQNPTHRSK